MAQHKRPNAAGNSRTQHRIRRKRGLAIAAVLFIVLLIAAVFWRGNFFGPDTPVPEEIESYARRQGISLSSYPEELIELYDKNPETLDFVLHYPENKNRDFTIDLSEYRECDTVPLLMQWDERWGYTKYAGELFGLSGCGPTCLSMVAIYLTGDTDFTPKAMAEFAAQNGYVSYRNGTSWTLFSEGAEKLGLRATELPLDEQRIINNLQEGIPIVCVMGPGDFTTTGHYIVMTGYEDGEISVNDPNRRSNSDRLWTYDRIKDQIRNLWAIQKAE